MKTKIPGISGSTLKWIAIITMLIDHFGAVVVNRTRVMEGFDHVFWGSLYWPLRQIGRVSFPIFCFLLVEGFLHTKDVKKYMSRMFIFALISEIPFDLAISGVWVYWKHQNVFWELFLGIGVIYLLQKIEEKQFPMFLTGIYKCFICILGMTIAEGLHFDYGAYGILSISLLWTCRINQFYQVVVGALSFIWEMPAPLGFLPVVFYNGKRGRNIKYFFYVFYPAHLFLLYVIARVIGCPY